MGLPARELSRERRPARACVSSCLSHSNLLHLNSRNVEHAHWLSARSCFKPLVTGVPGLQFNAHETGDGEILLRQHACKLGFEGVVSKRSSAAYAPGNQGVLAQVQMPQPTEFVIVGWTDPEGSRPYQEHCARLLP